MGMSAYTCVHFVLSRRQIDSDYLTLPQRHTSLSSCRQNAFKFNTSCVRAGRATDGGRRRRALLAVTAGLHGRITSAIRGAIRTLLKRNQAPSDFLVDDRPARSAHRVVAVLQRRPSSAATALAQSSGRLCPVVAVVTLPCN